MAKNPWWGGNATVKALGIKAPKVKSLGLTGRGGVGDLLGSIGSGAKKIGKVTGINEIPSAMADLGGYLFDWNPQPDYPNTYVKQPKNYNIPYPGKTTVPGGTLQSQARNLENWKPTSAGPTVRSSNPMLEDYGKPMPVPVSASTTPVATGGTPTPSQADILASLQKLMTPKTYGSLNLNVPTIAAPDMMPIYQKYSPLMGSAYDTLISQLGAERPGIIARDAATLQGAKDAWAASAGKTQSAVDAAKAKTQELFDRLGRSDQLLRPSGEALDAKVAELKGLTDILSTSAGNMQAGLNTARMGNLDTISSLASNSRAKAINDLLSQVTQGEITGQLQANKSNAALRLAAATGEADYQKLLAGIRGNEMNQGLNIWRTLQSLELAKQKAAAAGANANGMTGTETTTVRDQPFWQAEQELAQKNPVAGALMNTVWGQSGSNLSNAQAQLAKITGGDYAGLAQGPGNPITRALGLVGGIARQVPEISAAQQLLNLFTQTGALGYAGSPQTTQTLKSKGKS